jgi:hypothetical protein
VQQRARKRYLPQRFGMELLAAQHQRIRAEHKWRVGKPFMGIRPDCHATVCQYRLRWPDQWKRG